MSERILLVDVDSKIANLALMKLSAYHKARGDEVHLTRRGSPPLEWGGRADRAYVSCIFTWNRDRALKMTHGCTEVVLGGTGFPIFASPNSPARYNHLPPEVSAHLPDYSLYGVDYAVGFCNRGCLRKCQFCCVPQLEGPIRQERYSPPWDWVPDDKRKVLLLDNEMADYPYDQQREIYGWFRDSGRKWCQTQGYDLRIVARDDRLAPLLANYKPWALDFGGRRVYCAWDYIGNEAPVRKGIERLIAAGFRPSELTCYTIIGFNTTHEQDLHRFNVLWGEYGVLPYAMPYNNRKDDPMIWAFARYVNRGPALYRRHSFDDYLVKFNPELVIPKGDP